MKSSNNFLKVGKVKEAHGLKGELFVIVFAKQSPWADKIENFFLCPSQDWDPKTGQSFVLRSVRSIKQGLILGSPGIKDRTAAEKLLNQYLFIAEEHLTAEEGERIFLREILGFTVFDQEQKIGTIISFSSNGPQDLLVVATKSGPVEIPFVEAFTKEVQFGKKEVHMHLPEGLLELGDESQ